MQAATTPEAPRAFRMGAPAVCRSPFTFAGRKYRPGETFPYEELRLPAIELYGLWLALLIDTRESPPPPRPQVKSRGPR